MTSLSLPPIPTLPSHFGPIRQLGYVVDNIDDAMQQWHELGLTHFVVARRASPMANVQYRGKRAGRLVVDIAFAYHGDLQIELIEQIGTQASIYKEKKYCHPGMPHHYAVCVEDFPATMAKATSKQFSPVLSCGFEGLAQMAYIESHSESDLMLEVIEWNELTAPYFDGIHKLWSQADSSQLVHTFRLQSLTPYGALIRKLLTRPFRTRTQ